MIRRIVISIVTCAVLLPLVVMGSSTPVAAADGLSYRSTTTYSLDAQAGVVHVLAEISLTNTIPDRVEGNFINRRYFTGFSLPVPVGVTAAVATTANGRALNLVPRLIEGNGRFYVFDIDLASNLFYNQTANVRVAYDITGLPPRSENQSRVNNAYASFTAFGIGDDGKVTVRIIVPPGFEVETFGSDYEITEELGNTVYTATNIPNPEEFDIFVSARNDAGLVENTVETPDGDEFLLRTWPGDDEWLEFMTTQIQDGVPALSDAIGQPWPIDETLEVRQAYTPYLYGYAGWFSAADNEIEVGEDLDAEVMLHELSHAWFNDNWFTDRWVSEGFAQVYSNLIVEQTGGTPIEPDTPRSNDVGKVRLYDWGSPNFTDGADEVEDYGYNASYWLVQQLIDEIGEDKMREVLAAVAERTVPYVGEGPAESIDVSTDWRRLLDLLEEVGGSKEAIGLLEEYVITELQEDLLAERAEAREAYAQLMDDGGEWAPPLVVRRRMSAWSFSSATKLMEEAQDVLALRDELDEKAGELGTSYPDTFETDYQAVDKNFDEVAAAVQEQIDTADRVLAAVAADAQEDGVFDQVGLIGTDLPTLLDEAKAAFAEGDHDLARTKAQEVVDTIEKAPDVGKGRALWAGGAALLFLLLLTTLILLLRRRGRRRRARVAAAEQEQAAADAALLGSTAADDEEPIEGEPVDGEPLPVDPLEGEPFHGEPGAPTPDDAPPTFSGDTSSDSGDSGGGDSGGGDGGGGDGGGD